MNSGVSRTSDAAPRCIAKNGDCAEHYKAPRFESKFNRIGDTSGYRSKQDGAWEAPKNVHLIPASLRVGISLTPSHASRGRIGHGDLPTTSNDSFSRTTRELWSHHDEFHDMYETGHHETQTNIDGGPTATIGAVRLRKFFSFLHPREQWVWVRLRHPAVAKPQEGDRIERRPPAGVLGGGLQAPTPATHHTGGWWWWTTHHTGGWPASPRGGRHA